MCLLAFSCSVLSGQIADKAEDISPLLIGEKVPDSEILSLNGQKTSLIEIAQKQKAVVIFYRGGWCPYCNTHLAEIGMSEAEILKEGYQIIAISPDAISQLKNTVDKGKLNYNLYSDASGALTQTMGLAFKAPERYGQMLSNYSESQNPGILPVPSVFVLDTEGTILFEYISPNYKQRMSADLLLAVLRDANKKY